MLQASAHCFVSSRKPTNIVCLTLSITGDVCFAVSRNERIVARSMCQGVVYCLAKRLAGSIIRSRLQRKKPHPHMEKLMWAVFGNPLGHHGQSAKKNGCNDRLSCWGPCRGRRLRGQATYPCCSTECNAATSPRT